MSVALEPSVFGPIVTGADVEQWCLTMLKRWSGTYLSELERQHGYEAGQLQRVRSWVTTNSFDKWPEDQLPAVLLVSAGLIGDPPQREGGGAYRARWSLGLACIVSARDQAETHRQAMLYVAAHRAAILQRPSLEGHAAGVVWLDEAYDDLPYDDTRSLGAGQAIFTVEVRDVVHGNAGPLTPDDPLDPDTQPWPDDPTALTVDVAVQNEGVFSPTPGEPPPPPPPPDAPVPVLTSIAPDSAGDWNVELHAFGSGFTAESVIVVGLVDYPTTYVSDGDLSTVVPGSLPAGVYQVLVRTGTQESVSLPFTAL